MNVMEAPEQIEVADAAMETAGATVAFTVMVIKLEVSFDCV